MNNDEIHNQILKVGSAWGLFAITSWADFASVLAAMYSLLLISEWFWKKLWRPMLVRMGYLPALVLKKAQDE